MRAAAQCDPQRGIIDVKKRTTAALQGFDARAAQHEAENAVIESVWEKIADDAREKGEMQLAKAAHHAAADVAATGTLSAKTRGLLARVL